MIDHIPYTGEPNFTNLYFGKPSNYFIQQTAHLTLFCFSINIVIASHPISKSHHPNRALILKNVDQSRAMLKFNRRYHIHNHIYGIILGVNFLLNYFITFDNLPYEIKSGIDVVRLSMMNLILG